MVTRDGVLLTWKGLSGIMTLVAVGAIVVAVQAQQRPGDATLSAQDYIDIQQLVARYPYALDGSLGRGAVYADLFTADGVFINQDGRHDGGRAALEGLLEGKVHNRIVVPDHQKHWTKVALDRMLSVQ